MFGGIWGTIATGLFDNINGLFYGQPGSGAYFGYQCLGIVSVIAWVAFMSSLIFYIIKRFGLLRVDKAIELIGLDIAEMGGLSEDIYEKIRKDYAASLSPLSPRRKLEASELNGINLSNNR